MTGKQVLHNPPYIFVRRQRRIEQLRGKPGDIGRVMPANLVYRQLSTDRYRPQSKTPASS